MKMNTQKHNHAEAFCLMIYQCEKCGLRETLWNSRDGVTPFCIGCSKCDGEMRHADWQKDRRALNYAPQPGQRIFVDMTQERAEEIADKRIEFFKGTEWESPPEEVPALRNALIKDMMRPGTPDIKTWPEKIKIPKARRTEGIYEQAYKDLLFYVRAALCQECLEGVVEEVKIIERRMKEKMETAKEREGKAK